MPILQGGTRKSDRLLERLPKQIQQRALQRLHTFRFPAADVAHIRVDAEGGVFYEDPVFEKSEKAIDSSAYDAQVQVPDEPTLLQTLAPVNPSKVFNLHSKLGASRKVYLNMAGATLTGTIWNSNSGRATLNMLPYSQDNAYDSYTQNELDAIAETWKRVSDDYAPFDIDVTTERPASFGPQVGHILVTRRTDRNNYPIYPNNVGGVAYIDVWGDADFIYYQPALVFTDGVGSGPHDISEAASHELGHNLSLSHDGANAGCGATSSVAYYSGNGTGMISWAPIMGVGYYSNVTQWSKGEYPCANNMEDDLALIATRLTYRLDDHGNTPGQASALIANNNNAIYSTTPVLDPDNTQQANKGILENRNDFDYFYINTTAGTIDLTISPVWIDQYFTQSLRGANPDIKATLLNGSSQVLATSNQTTDTYARVVADVAGGSYYLKIETEGAGTPPSGPGYTTYASIGQYFINGTVPPPTPSTYTLTVNRSGTGTGTVTSSSAGIDCGSTCSANFSTGTNVALTPAAAGGSTFASWSGCNSVSGTTCNVTMNATKSVTATFNIQTTTYPLTITKSGSGTVTSVPAGINCGVTCSYTFSGGQSVALTPTPANGYYFSSWSGACSGSEACTVTMDAAKTVNANFTAIPVGHSVLSVTKTGLGSVTSAPVGINCSGTCNATFANGTIVTLTAAPVTGYYFAGWTGACSGQGTCTLTIDGNKSAAASFVQIPANQQLLTITVSGSGSVTTSPGGFNCSSSCSFPFTTGTAVSLIPTANTGQTFTGWSGVWCSGRSSCMVTMSDPRSVGATFKNTYSLIMPAINLLLLGD